MYIPTPSAVKKAYAKLASKYQPQYPYQNYKPATAAKAPTVVVKPRVFFAGWTKISHDKMLAEHGVSRTIISAKAYASYVTQQLKHSGLEISGVGFSQTPGDRTVEKIVWLASGSSAAVSYEGDVEGTCIQDQLQIGWWPVALIHSHPTFSAYFSSVDDAQQEERVSLESALPFGISRFVVLSGHNFQAEQRVFTWKKDVMVYATSDLLFLDEQGELHEMAHKYSYTAGTNVKGKSAAKSTTTAASWEDEYYNGYNQRWWQEDYGKKWDDEKDADIKMIEAKAQSQLPPSWIFAVPFDEKQIEENIWEFLLENKIVLDDKSTEPVSQLKAAEIIKRIEKSNELFDLFDNRLPDMIVEYLSPQIRIDEDRDNLSLAITMLADQDIATIVHVLAAAIYDEMEYLGKKYKCMDMLMGNEIDALKEEPSVI